MTTKKTTKKAAKSVKKTAKKVPQKAVKKPSIKVVGIGMKGKTGIIQYVRTPKHRPAKVQKSAKVPEAPVDKVAQDFENWLRENIDREEWPNMTLKDAVCEFCEANEVDLATATDAEWAQALVLVPANARTAYRKYLRDLAKDFGDHTVAFWIGEEEEDEDED